jgi:hypothetical protein
MSTKKAKKNEEVSKPATKGILAFFSKPKISNDSPSPDAVQNIENMVNQSSLSLTVNETPRKDEPEPVQEQEYEVESIKAALPVIVIATPCETNSQKVFPMFQKPKERSASFVDDNQAPTESLSSTSSGKVDSSVSLKTPTSIEIIPKTTIRNTDEVIEIQEETPRANSSVSNPIDVDVIPIPDSPKIIDLSYVSPEIPLEYSQNSVEPPMNTAVHDISVEDESIKDNEIKSDLSQQPIEKEEVEQEEDSGHRRSSRIRTKKDEFAKKLEEQRALMESSDDDSYNVISRGSNAGRSKTSKESKSEDGTEPQPTIKKKKVASIFISKVFICLFLLRIHFRSCDALCLFRRKKLV